MEKYRRVRCAADWGLRFMTMFVMERVIAPFTSKYSDAWDFENSSPIGIFFPMRNLLFLTQGKPVVILGTMWCVKLIVSLLISQKWENVFAWRQDF
jgi:hypothetical protein